MANYNTRVKTFFLDSSDLADTVAGSLAKVVNDYVQTLDDTTGTVLQMGMVPLGAGSRIMVWILHLG
jgi:hypothetical protein